jgi:hypothetical protein
MNQSQRLNVKIMWDYYAFPVWTYVLQTGWQQTADTLEIPEALARMLSAWSCRWTDALAGSDSPQWVEPSEADRLAWVEEGRDLAAALARYLGSEAEVIYFNEFTQESEVITDRPRRAPYDKG